MIPTETPARIWRRIQENEQRDMPSLPSLPGFTDDSADIGPTSSEDHNADTNDEDDEDDQEPIHSTPLAASSNAASTIRPSSRNSSAARFANSIASRSFKSSRSTHVDRGRYDSFDVSVIPALPTHDSSKSSDDLNLSKHSVPSPFRHAGQSRKSLGNDASVPEIYLPPEIDQDREFSITDALESISRPSSPQPRREENTPQKSGLYDYQPSPRSESKPSPFDKLRSVALRRPLAGVRTPSLTHTSSHSSLSSPPNSTPRSGRSVALPESPLSATYVPLPRSRTNSPFVPPAAAQHNRRDSDEHSTLSFSSREDQSDPCQQPSATSQTESHEQPESMDESEVQAKAPAGGLRDATFSIDSVSGQSQQDRTFSSNSGPSPFARPSPRPELASPAPSTAFEATPLIVRPRTRFVVPPHPLAGTTTPAETPARSDEQMDSYAGQAAAPLTPHSRRRSFLLSVINSSARPRLKVPATPFARIPLGDSLASMTPASNTTTPFGGVTPRPRPRGSLSLLPSPIAEGDSTSNDEQFLESELEQHTIRAATMTPVTAIPARKSVRLSLSPYETEKASFISTASSHDLTTHHPVNTSFDHVMGSHGLGKFNNNKLIVYLHGLNRRLQEENEILNERLAEKEGAIAPRRLSNVLGNVQEDTSGEAKKELEQLVETLEEEVQRLNDDKAKVEQELDEEREGRAKDKDKWRDRMNEVEKGVAEIISGLEAKLHRAEASEKAVLKEKEKADHRIHDLEEQLEQAVLRAERADIALESGRELGGELKEANDRVSKVSADLRKANARIEDLEHELGQADERNEQLEKELESLLEELHAKDEQLASQTSTARRSEKDSAELATIKAQLAEAEADADTAVERIQHYESELATALETIEHMDVIHDQQKDALAQLQAEVNRKNELFKQTEDALFTAETKIDEDDKQISQLKGTITTLERDNQRLQERIQSLKDASKSLVVPAGPTEAELEALEDELDAANKEIARLNTLLNQSPARKAMDKAKDTKIEILEREKEELIERVKSLKSTITGLHTPTRVVSQGGISPLHRQAINLSIRAPRTPGGPLRELSWLNSTYHDPSVSPLVAEISRLQRELDRANDSIDDKIGKLEDAGLDLVGLTKTLNDARNRISELEDDVAKLGRKEERHLRRLERLRCQKCHAKVDARATMSAGEDSLIDVAQDSLPSDPPTPPTKTSEALRTELHAVNSELIMLKAQWEAERRKLQGENAALQDTTNRLNSQVTAAKNEAKKLAEQGKIKDGFQTELEHAKEVISDLEAALKAERARLRAINTEQDHVIKEKEDVLLQLKRTESDMEDVKEQLLKLKKENYDLEKELRANTNVDQKARLLEAKVAENIETIEHLRQERSILVADHKALQQRFSAVSADINRLRGQQSVSQASHDNHRHQLDLRLHEIEDLRRQLAAQSDELKYAESEKNRMSVERQEITQAVTALENDLRRVRRDAEAFGRDLKRLQREKDELEARRRDEEAKAERVRKQNAAQIQLLNEQLDAQREQASWIRQKLDSHTCGADDQQIIALKQQHNKECKGLAVHIRYLKAKFIRESTLRSDLGFQKSYLMILLASYERSEKSICAAIARIGFPVAQPPPVKRRTLKVVAICATFIARAKKASDLWRKECASKEAVAAALEEVRRRRAANAIQT